MRAQTSSAFQRADNSARSITDVCVAPKVLLRATLARSLSSTIKQLEKIVDNKKEIYNMRADLPWRRTNSSPESEREREKEIYIFCTLLLLSGARTGVFFEETKVGHLPREQT